MDHFLNVSLPYMNSFKPNPIPPRIELFVSVSMFLLLIASVAGTVRAQVTGGSRASEQSHFGAEVRIRNPIEIPSDVLSVLRNVKRNQTCLRDGQSTEDITKSWFVGSKINLNGDRVADLVVTARNECLMGANIVPFWVFR